jgi:hypothetical protein
MTDINIPIFGDDPSPGTFNPGFNPGFVSPPHGPPIPNPSYNSVRPGSGPMYGGNQTHQNNQGFSPVIPVPGNGQYGNQHSNTGYNPAAPPNYGIPVNDGYNGNSGGYNGYNGNSLGGYGGGPSGFGGSGGTYGPPGGYTQGYGNDNGNNPPGWNPVLDNPIGRIGIETARVWTDGVQQKGQRYFDSLRPYFNVKKSYVQSKLRILLFPFFHKSWHRTQESNPNFDINAPDLYIPLMSIVTYILLVGFFMGTQFKFTPDVLGKTLTTVTTMLVLEVLAIKGASFVWPHQTPILDILAYSGYKYIGVIINVIVGLAFGNYGYYVAFLLTIISTSLFQVETFRSILTETGSSKKIFLILLVLMQILSCLFLCNMEYSNGLLFSTL